MADPCPTDDELRQAIAGTLNSSRQEQIESHLEGCEQCQRKCSELSGAFPVTGGDKTIRERSKPSFELQRVIERLSGGGCSSYRTEIEWHTEWIKECLGFLHPSETPGSLGRLGQYEIRRLIGRGGMGLVLEALDTVLNRTVAIKVLTPGPRWDDLAKSRFLREARAAAALHHENIVAVHSVSFDSVVPFLVLEYVEGESLAERLRHTGTLPFDELVRIGLETARGLAAAHARGIVHRDIKPGNILLERETGRVKIADFGLATQPADTTLTQEGTFAGTPEFTSPEQARGLKSDARSDLFSLGAVLYLAATGISPFAASQPILVLERVRQAKPQPLREVAPTLPAWFCAIVERLLEKDPRNRIQSASELVRLLERSQSPRKQVRRFSRGLAAGLVCAAIVLPLAGLLYHWYQPPPEPRPQVGDQLPESGFVISGRAGFFQRLNDAMAIAKDNDVILVHGDGPFPTPPMQTNGKRLTVQAARNSRPVFISETPNRDSDAPMITADGDLRLEGVTVYWRTKAPLAVKSESSMLSSAAIASTQGSLQVVHCRIIAAEGCNCVSASVPELVVSHCHLISGQEAAIFWRPVPGGRLAVEGCALEGGTGLTLLTAAEASNLAPSRLNLKHNTFAVGKTFQLVIQVGPKQPLRVDASHNIFDHEQVVHLYATRIPKNFLPDTTGKRLALVRSLLQWSDEGNLYRRGQGVGLYSILAPREVHRSALTRLEDWFGIWGQTNPSSVEGRIHFHKRQSKEQEAPRLDRVEEASGPVPAGIGAEPGRVGPQ